MSIVLQVDERGGIALPADVCKRLGVSSGGAVQAEETPAGLLLKAQRQSAERSKSSLLDELDRILAKVPAEELAKLPRDGAEQHDHYIYGTPKRPPNGEQ